MIHSNYLTFAFLISLGFLPACESQNAKSDLPVKTRTDGTLNTEAQTKLPKKTCLNTMPEAVSLKAVTTSIGNNKTYPEEAPRRTVTLNAFEIDATEVTNAQFAKFVSETRYITDAQKPQAGFIVAGGAVFRPPTPSRPEWWQFVEGSNWQHPEGPKSNIIGHETDPVVQISLRDAKAYAAWKGRRLPTEPEWEHAAKAGAETLYIWGEERTPDGIEQANTWQGLFPIRNTKDDGYARRAPVGCYKPNGNGLYDMIGNVWEWTDTPMDGDSTSPTHVIKGGSFLCAENYCKRYRASARQPHETDFTTNHIGFRTVKDIDTITKDIAE